MWITEATRQVIQNNIIVRNLLIIQIIIHQKAIHQNYIIQGRHHEHLLEPVIQIILLEKVLVQIIQNRLAGAVLLQAIHQVEKVQVPVQDQVQAQDQVQVQAQILNQVQIPVLLHVIEDRLKYKWF
jgi:hypothetical protein